jgi:Glycosyl transferase family 11
MVITKLYGGLGNQMFQYAAGLAVARRLDATLFVDTTWFEPRRHPPESPPLRGYELASFGIRAAIPLRTRLSLRLRKPQIFSESGFRYDPEIERLSGDVFLDGYWQSYRYFDSIADDVRDAFHATNPRSGAAKELLARIADENAIAVHVRRGDYAANPKLTRKFGLLSREYYHQATALIGRNTGEFDAYVFSDDIDWCRGNLALRAARSVAYVSGTDGVHEDMLLMTRCRHHVIANSSFSWWGAWLANHPDKIVVAPARWFNDPPVDTSDLIPPEWRRL